MTEVEATEVVLQGRAWTLCPTLCDPRLPHGDHRRGSRTPCTHCGGKGMVLTQDYKDACALMGKPLPTYSRSASNAEYEHDRG
jgi:hypothetical protein